MPSFDILEATAEEEWDGEDLVGGFYPIIKYGGKIVWKSKAFYYNEEKATEVAQDHLIERLQNLFE